MSGDSAPTRDAMSAAGGPQGGLSRPLPLEEARRRVLEEVGRLPLEWVSLDDAPGRVLAEDVLSRETLPPWDNSAMDGFAVRAADVAPATPAAPVLLRVIGESAAGHVPERVVAPGTALRITTGAMLPDGADAVVPVEDTDAPPGAAALPPLVAVRVAPGLAAHVRRAGEDVRVGDVVLRAGAVVGPAAVALLAATGVARVPVHRRPRVGVIATGDELVPVAETLGPARIHDSNGPSLLAQARAAGADARAFGIAADDPFALRELLAAAAAASDVVVLSGGVSVGAHDHVRAAFEELGEVAFWRVAIQPGKPIAFGRTTGGRAGDAVDPDRPVWLFGLPGNPVSAFVTFELFVRPLLRRLAGREATGGRRVVRARLAEPMTKAAGRRAFLRVRLEADPADPSALIARPAGGQGSHMLSSLAAADALAVIPEDVPGLPAGSDVEAWELEDEGA